MAKQVLLDAVVEVDGNDLSDHCSTVEIADTADDAEFTAFAPAASREFGRGLKNAQVTLNVFQDHESGQVDDVLYPIWENDQPCLVKVKASSAATSTANPAYLMEALLFSYQVGGEIGDAVTLPVEFRNASSTGMVRADHDVPFPNVGLFPSPTLFPG